MANLITPFQLLAIALAGWLNRRQQAVIDCLIEEHGRPLINSMVSSITSSSNNIAKTNRYSLYGITVGVRINGTLISDLYQPERVPVPCPRAARRPLLWLR